MDSGILEEYVSGCERRNLSKEDIDLLKVQDSRIVSFHKAQLAEMGAKKYWDMFYKRNGNKFFKDRHWTVREFGLEISEVIGKNKEGGTLLEVGCGVGNLFYPLIEDDEHHNWEIWACDFSPRAVDIVKQHPLYNPAQVHIFQADVTDDNCWSAAEFPNNGVDVATLIFVLSAIHPTRMGLVATNIFKALRPGGLLLFRDYGLFDMAQMRFKPGTKIDENLYLRQDGTRSYFFSLEKVEEIFCAVGFELFSNCYIHRRTVNKKEGIDVPRIFVQTKLLKPSGL